MKEKLPKYLARNLGWIFFTSKLGILTMLFWWAMCMIGICWLGLVCFGGWCFVAYFMIVDIRYEARKGKFVEGYFERDEK